MNNSYLTSIFTNCINKLSIDIDLTELQFDTPKDIKHGDLSTNIAMRLTKKLKKSPHLIAQDIIDNLEYDKDLIENISIAGAGFINIKFTNKYYQQELQKIYSAGDEYGKIDIYKGKKINVEYVSANPTGLLHLGHGRNAAIGDTLANIYQWCGADVTREYYFNNAGNQMNNLTKSIYARYMQIIEDENFPFPEDGYHGSYVKIIAEELVKKYDKQLTNIEDKNTFKTIKDFGESWCFDKIRKTLDKMNVHQDIFFNEDSLYKDGKIVDVLSELKEKDLSYEKEGATWFALSKLGLESDRVIVKSTGEPTYRLPDIAYHREKLKRGYDLVVDLFGADHIATVPDVLAGVKALGFDVNKVKVIIHQFVTLMENGEQVKMSKRTGKSYTLDDLLDEVGADVVRYFLIMRSVNTHLEFELSIAREQSDKNPVFYLQYAHARICSILEKLKNENIDLTKIKNADLSYLNDDSEIKLIKTLILFPQMLQIAAEKSEPHILCEYLKDVAAAFHVFYHNCRIIGSEENILISRLLLSNAAKTVLRNGMRILGVSYPEKM
ncbi:MAG: arginine--tRNA ligase [Bacteroidetes bacterium]|nr:arginine--tRNA ligase [Bacteroidota bacterium]